MTMRHHMSDPILTQEEFVDIARDMEQYHAIFSKLWQMGKPRFDDSIPTAAVGFDADGQFFDFVFNPDFWKKCSQYERMFIICHEALHIIFNHGERLIGLDREIGNVSADVVINELLVNGFGFNRKSLKWADKNACWLDTVFPDQQVQPNRAMEYYYGLLEQKGSSNLPSLVDDHSKLSGMLPEEMEGMVEDLLNDLSDGEKQVFKDVLDKNNPEEVEKCEQQRGSIAGNLSMTIKLGNVKKKRKWETVIKRWATMQIKTADKDHEQWARVNRRFVTLVSDLFLPSEMEIEDRDETEKKIKVVFFQDTSGSCFHLAKRFFAAAKSLPKDRFDVDLHCFDTRVYKTTLESGKLYGFGGTSFDILENYVMKNIAKGKLSKYPKAIFVITDGYGNRINPAITKRWHWFLNTGYSGCIPNTCNIHQLSKFE